MTNAGGNVASSHDGSLESIADGYRRNFAANVLTSVLLTEALLPRVRRPGGRIVHLSSIAALRGPGSYGGAKAAVNTYTFELAQRLGAEGITVNAVAPGFVADTEFFGDEPGGVHRLAGEADLDGPGGTPRGDRGDGPVRRLARGGVSHGPNPPHQRRGGAGSPGARPAGLSLPSSRTSWRMRWRASLTCRWHRRHGGVPSHVIAWRVRAVVERHTRRLLSSEEASPDPATCRCAVGMAPYQYRRAGMSDTRALTGGIRAEWRSATRRCGSRWCRPPCGRGLEGFQPPWAPPGRTSGNDTRPTPCHVATWGRPPLVELRQTALGENQDDRIPPRGRWHMISRTGLYLAQTVIKD